MMPYSPLQSSKKHTSGFTLLEILVAISIFAVLATLVYSSLNAVLSKNNTIKGGTQVYKMGKNCLTRMTYDLTGTFVTQYPEYQPPDYENPSDPYRFVGEADFVGSNTFSRLRFASTAHLPTSMDEETGIGEIRYYVETDKASPSGYVLKRADTPYPYDIEDDLELNRNDPVLCDGIESLSFSFIDADGNQQDTWDSESDFQQYATPQAVIVDLAVRSKSGTHRFSTRIDIPAYREGIENVRE